MNHQPFARRELDDQLGQRTEVDAFDDDSLDTRAARVVVDAADPDLLRAHGDLHGLAGGASALDADARAVALLHHGEVAVAFGDRHPQRVGGADEVGHERGRGALVERARIGELLDPTAVHDRDPVRHRQRLLLVVGDVDEGRAGGLLDPLQLELHLAPQLQVERAERLVEQQRGRAVHQRPRERDPLALAAGELSRPPVGEPLEADDPDHLLGPGGGLRPCRRA